MSKFPSSNFLKNIISRASKNLSWLFLLGLTLLVILEAVEIKQSINVIINSNQEPVATTPERGVRIDFETYQKIVNRIESAQNFRPTSTISSNPFGTR